MQKIRFTYTSTEIKPSVFLLLFFRMVGIYVYERFLESTDKYKQELLQTLGRDINNEQTEWSDFDLDLYYAYTETELEEDIALNEKSDIGKALYIISEGLVNQDETVPGRILIYQETGTAFLQSLINKMYLLQMVDENQKKELFICADIYCKNKIWEQTLKSKYFYAAEEQDGFVKIMKAYRHITDKLLQKLAEGGRTWGSDNSFYIQYATLNMAYEGNQYCSRNRKAMWYNSQGLVELCEDLLSIPDIGKKMGDSTHLLLAQIYDDLLRDRNIAYRHYELACKDYNAYAYFKKGCYWQDYAKDYQKAIEYYAKSVMIYPEYYRAWYRLGNCYTFIDRYGDALRMFRNVDRILSLRQKKKSIRPMEIEYLFKAHNQCGYIWNKVYNEKLRSIMANNKAIETWNSIEESDFYYLLGDEKQRKSVIERTQKELNVNKIKMEIAKLTEA